MRKRYVQGIPAPGQRYAADANGNEVWIDPAGEADLTTAGAFFANGGGEAPGSTTQEKIWSFMPPADFRAYLGFLNLPFAIENGASKLLPGVGGISVFAESGAQHRLPYQSNSIPFAVSGTGTRLIACVA